MNNSLKETHPQKYYSRIACKAIFYLGLGTCWYEAEKTQYPRLYAAWCLLIHGYIALGTLDKILAYLRPDISHEVNEITQQVCTEVVIILKFYVLILKRQSVRRVLKTMHEDHRDIFIAKELEAKTAKKVECLCCLFCFGTYMYVTGSVLQMIILSYKEGTPLQIYLMYFPTSAHVGFPFDLLRILVIGHFYVLVAMMVVTDCLNIMTLVFVAAKFKQVQVYFNMIREKSENWNAEDFKKRVINGIKLHELALWCARNVQSGLAPLYGIQISVTIVFMGLCLLKLASLQRTLANLLVQLLFALSLSTCTACYMLIAGEISHEAAGVATAVVHCGWERGRSRGARALFVVAMQRAQQPVLMTAFGVFILSHENFVRVLRAAYSFFAVVY